MVGPALGGAIIAVFGLGWAYGIDVVTFVAMLISVWMIHPQRPPAPEKHEPFFRSLVGGLRFAWSRGS